jgi:hypothetical protein
MSAGKQVLPRGEQGLPGVPSLGRGTEPGRRLVYREKRMLESYQQEVQAKDTQFHECREDNRRLLAEKGSPGGLRECSPGKR